MPFEKGKSGNPGGRSKGRKKFAEHFVTALCDDFIKHGADAIVKVREEDPSTYLRVCATIIPKDIELNAGEGLIGLLSAIGRAESGHTNVEPMEETRPSGICH